MSIARKRTKEEQYQLILECRSSGLTDYQWCMEHDIKPGTFYNWVKRLRKDTNFDVPARTDFQTPCVHDVVRLDIIPDETEIIEPAHHNTQATEISATMMNTYTIEIQKGDIHIGISNNADPVLLSKVIQAIAGDLC